MNTFTSLLRTYRVHVNAACLYCIAVSILGSLLQSMKGRAGASVSPPSHPARPVRVLLRGITCMALMARCDHLEDPNYVTFVRALHYDEGKRCALHDAQHLAHDMAQPG